MTSILSARAFFTGRRGVSSWFSRVLPLAGVIAFGLLSYEAFTSEWLLRHAFSGFLDKAAADRLGKRMDALTGRTSLYDILSGELGHTGDPFGLIRLAAKEIGADDPDVKALLALELDVRRADRALAWLSLSAFIISLLLLYRNAGPRSCRNGGEGWLKAADVTPGTGEAASRGGGTGLESAVAESDPAGGSTAGRVPPPPPLGQVILDFVLGSASSAGEILVAVNPGRLADACSTGLGTGDERIGDELTARLSALCTGPHRIVCRRGNWSLRWEGVPLVAVSGTEAGGDGLYRLDTGLHSRLFGRTLRKALPLESMALPMLGGPMLYEIWKVAWDAFNPPGGGIEHSVQLPLLDLVRDAGIAFDRDSRVLTLGRLHECLEELRRNGFIDGWTVTEDGRAAPPSWYERVDLFRFDEDRGAYLLDRDLLAGKIYRLWCHPASAVFSSPASSAVVSSVSVPSCSAQSSPARQVPGEHPAERGSAVGVAGAPSSDARPPSAPSDPPFSPPPSSLEGGAPGPARSSDEQPPSASAGRVSPPSGASGIVSSVSVPSCSTETSPARQVPGEHPVERGSAVGVAGAPSSDARPPSAPSDPPFSPPPSSSEGGAPGPVPSQSRESASQRTAREESPAEHPSAATAGSACVESSADGPVPTLCKDERSVILEALMYVEDGFVSQVSRNVSTCGSGACDGLVSRNGEAVRKGRTGEHVPGEGNGSEDSCCGCSAACGDCDSDPGSELDESGRTGAVKPVPFMSAGGTYHHGPCNRGLFKGKGRVGRSRRPVGRSRRPVGRNFALCARASSRRDSRRGSRHRAGANRTFGIRSGWRRP